jgi:hypothetical protein
MFTPIGCSWIGLMRRRAAVAAVVLATAVVLAARPITAQSGDGAIAGVVKDGTGAALPGVTMTITSLDRGTISAATHTAADGSYTAVALPPGTYSVTAELSGFTKQEVKPLTLRIADRLHVDVILGLASLAETVTVTGHSETILRRDTSSLAETITPEQVKQLPLFARNPMNLVQLVGGVAGGTDVEGSLATAQLSINGSRTANTEVTIDGVSAVVGSTGDITFIPSVEALQEFKVQTSSYSSEYGRTSGGTISAIVQSGTSRFKGSTYGYFRDAKFNANNYFNQSRGIAKPADRFKQFGASIGGPVKEISSGTFFFFNYEGLRRTVPRQFTSTLPTDALRKGDLSGFATPIIDPATGAQVRDPSRATPGNPLGLNIIPAGRIDPAAQAIIGSLPLPNQPGLSNNYVTTSEDSVDLNQFNTRIDHSIGTAARLSGRYSQQTGVNPGFTGDASTIIPGPMNPGTGANHPVDRQLSLNYSQTIGSSLVHEATVGANLNKQTLNPPGVIDSPSTLGFTRAPQLPFDGNSGYYAPAIQFAGGVNWGYGANRVQQLGMNANALRRQNTTTWQIGDSVTWIHAAHTVKGGGQIRFNKLDIFNGGAAFAGIYTISGDMLPGAPSSSQATEWAALLFGLVESAQYAIPQPELRGVSPGRLEADRPSHPQSRPAVGIRVAAHHRRERLLAHRSGNRKTARRRRQRVEFTQPGRRQGEPRAPRRDGLDPERQNGPSRGVRQILLAVFLEPRRLRRPLPGVHHERAVPAPRSGAAAGLRPGSRHAPDRRARHERSLRRRAQRVAQPAAQLRRRLGVHFTAAAHASVEHRHRARAGR